MSKRITGSKALATIDSMHLCIHLLATS